MAQTWSELLPLTYLLHDRTKEMARIFDQIDALSDALYEQLAVYDHAKIINIGENLHQALLSPRYFEAYYIPYYEKRLAQLHAGGKFCHIHIDGDFHDLLPYLKNMSFDGYEALTPTPQGDVTLEEMRDAIGEKVLLDGIPAIYFMPNVPREVLMACVEKLHTYFSPRLILGASDEVPQGCDSVEAIERVKMIATWCREHQ
jgi:uroporphyrinogen-III decarboxylase